MRVPTMQAEYVALVLPCVLEALGARQKNNGDLDSLPSASAAALIKPASGLPAAQEDVQESGVFKVGLCLIRAEG